MRGFIICLFFFTAFSTNAQFKLSIASVEVNPEEVFCVDVTVEGFTQIVSTQLRITWDTTLIQFDSTTNLGVENNGLLFSQNENELRFTWVATDIEEGSTLEEGAVLFAICYSAIKEGEVIVAVDENLNMLENPVIPEIASATGGEIADPLFEEGTVTITAASSCNLSIALMKSGLNCFDSQEADGVIEAMVEGGSGDYSYNWSTGATTASITNLSPDRYSVTVTDGEACSTEEEIILEIPEEVVISIRDTQNMDCTNAINVSVVGGTPPYEYQLDEMPFVAQLIFTDLDPKDYMLIVKDQNGCITAPVPFTIQEALTVGTSCDDGDATTTNDVITENCECKGTTEGNGGTNPPGECSTIRVEIEQAICRGQSYLGYQESGTYQDTLKTINGCDSIRTLTLSVGDRIRTQIDTIICEGGMVEGQTVKGSYIDIFTSVAGCDSIRILNLSVTPADDASCSTTAVIDLAEDNTFQIGPNPVDDMVIISSKVGIPNNTTISIYTIYGQLINTSLLTAQQMTVPMGHLSNGTYLLLIESAGKRYLQKIVK